MLELYWSVFALVSGKLRARNGSEQSAPTEQRALRSNVSAADFPTPSVSGMALDGEADCPILVEKCLVAVKKERAFMSALQTQGQLYANCK